MDEKPDSSKIEMLLDVGKAKRHNKELIMALMCEKLSVRTLANKYKILIYYNKL